MALIVSTCQLIFFVLYRVAFVNCLLKAFALSMSVIVVLVSKRMFLSVV